MTTGACSGNTCACEVGSGVCVRACTCVRVSVRVRVKADCQGQPVIAMGLTGFSWLHVLCAATSVEKVLLQQLVAVLFAFLLTSRLLVRRLQREPDLPFEPLYNLAGQT